MINEPRGAAPHHHIAAFEAKPPHGVGTPLAAPQKHGGQSERNGDDGRPGVLLVAILMQAELGARDIAVDQASVGIVGGEPTLGGGAYGEIAEAAGIAGQGAPVSGSMGS